MSAAERQATFERLMADYDAKALQKAVKFDAHRYVSIERDSISGDHFAKGHRGIRSACDYMARALEEGEPMVPDKILDLDEGEFSEVDVFAFVAPRELDAIAVMMPRALLASIRELVRTSNSPNADHAAPETVQAFKLIEQALERRP